MLRPALRRITVLAAVLGGAGLIAYAAETAGSKPPESVGSAGSSQPAAAAKDTCPGDPGVLPRQDCGCGEGDPDRPGPEADSLSISDSDKDAGTRLQLSDLPDAPREEAGSADRTADAASDAESRRTAALSPAALRLRDEIRRCLAYYYLRRPESIAERGPWGVMHAVVGYGVDTRLLIGRDEANAIGWLCWNRPCYGYRLFATERGELKVNLGEGYQGHEGQFLMIMAWSKVPRSYGLKVDGRSFTIEDVIRYEQRTCRRNSELSFKLYGLVHYLGTDATWRNDQGELWTIDQMLREELKQPVVGAACGGTHRLEALGFAVRKRLLRNEPFTGQWARARTYVEDFIDYTYSLQNPDGSFSTAWFEKREDKNDIDRKLNTTGHMLEWLLIAVPDSELESARLQRSLVFVKDLLWQHRDREWEVGPKGHAIHALALYDERVFGGRPGPERKLEFARILGESQLR